MAATPGRRTAAETTASVTQRYSLTGAGHHPWQVSAFGALPAYGAGVAGWGHASSGRAAAPARPGAAGERQPPPAGPPPRPSPREKLNTGGLLYGTVVSAAALSVGADRGDSAADLIDAMIATVVIYWLAHVYTATVSGRDPDHPVRLRHRLASAARREATILAGGLP